MWKLWSDMTYGFCLAMMQFSALLFRLAVYMARWFCLLLGTTRSLTKQCQSRSHRGRQAQTNPIVMPGRVSARPATTPYPTGNPSSRTLPSRKSTISPSLVVPEEGPDSTLRTQISNAFADAQKSTAGHRKLAVGLRRLQETCVDAIGGAKGRSTEHEEEVFNAEFARCVIRVTGVKKSESVGDRIVRFVGYFLRHASEKGMEPFSHHAQHL